MAKLVTGQVAVTGARAPLSTDIAVENKFLVLKAPATNTAAVYFGDSAVTTASGHALDPGESFDIDNGNAEGTALLDIQPRDIYVVGTAPDVVTWVSAGR